MDILAAITWNVGPDIFSFEIPIINQTLTIRWYGLLFASAFLVGQYIMIKIFKEENKPEKDIDALTLYMIVATLVGARLGHCLFYQPEFYLSNPIEILKVWEGGLASHGATVGILLGIYLYSRSRHPDQSYLWVLDRIVIVTALGGAFIRLGNLFNSEIIGLPTNLPWGFVFVKLNEDFARHPAQLYEAISCVFLFLFLFWLWGKTKEKTPEGRLFGIFVVVLFGLRIFYEFLKENQVDFENGLPLNMGQILSIPMVLIGMYILLKSSQKKKQESISG
ncbi:MAG: prolipoprotein diacylglyceryl transferase [Thermoflexibacter sp.]|jgi:prolipoprotein diacylglyceryl transferase|nr:prolipoprotein diacylglyceryl transferase [Thermoflexibacter sp.]